MFGFRLRHALASVSLLVWSAVVADLEERTSMGTNEQTVAPHGFDDRGMPVNTDHTGRVSVHMASANGARNVSVGLTTDGLRALIMPSGPEQDDEAYALAMAVCDAETTRAIYAMRLAQRDAEIARLRSTVERVACERDAARSTLTAAISGKRRFNSAVLCKPHSGGDWGGAVWLLDPEKQEGGFGMLFGSLAELRRAHPELWIVGAVDGGILLDAFVLGGAQ